MPRGVRAPKAKPQPAVPAATSDPAASQIAAPVVPSVTHPTAEQLAAHPPGGVPLNPALRYFMVAEHITPSTKRHPGATMQYVAGHFYLADEFLTKLWRGGDPCITPYDPAEKV